MPDLQIESQYKSQIVAGVDEVGRGPLAGPVVACAVIIKPEIIIEGINDSKKLSPKKREELNNLIIQHYHYSIGEASVIEIDEFNILQATKLAIKRAVNGLTQIPDVVLVDGNMKFEDSRYLSIIKGDTVSLSIAAGSIVAKVYRDKLMKKLALEYPEYNWDKNSGYGTSMHVSAIEKHGITPLHRKKFVSNIHF
jgi:ribonuclease HII